MNSKLEIELEKIEKKSPIKNDGELIAALSRIVDAEAEKASKDQDIELMQEAIDYILILRGEDPEQIEKESEKAKNEFLEKMKREHFTKPESKSLRSRSPLKPILIAAVIVVIMAVGIVATLRTLDFDLVDLKTFLGLKTDVEYEDKDQSLTITDNFGEYKSISDFLEKENLESILIFDESVRNVSIADREDYKIITVEFNNDRSLKISTDQQVSFDINNTTKINEFDVFIIERGETVQGDWIYKGLHYTAFAESVEELTEIINTIKEYSV